ncbi:MAG TPA: tetratricopeptide repeat protein [Gemmatales bacterium]|nr:tetratricopeptide repeat protein [Gemmatales bacterium]HMP59211.1 tetratricopeptide repeat protein [Gemmatales bacterium]
MSVEPSVGVLCQKARQALAEGNPQLARQCFFQALAQAPEMADIHYGLGTTCFLLGDLNGAVYHFSETIRLDSSKVGAYINLGAVYNQMGKADDALQVLRQAVKLDSKRAEAYYNLGLAYRHKGQPELAIQAYREAIHRNPRMVDTHYNLANLLQDLGRLPQALVHYREAVKLDSNFEAARVGVEQIELLVQSEQQANAEKSSVIKRAPVTESKLDMTHPLDPRFDGPALQALHRTTIVSENTCRDLARILEDELESAIKELSSALLYNATATELADKLEKFERAMNRTRAVQKAWQQNMQKLRELNEKLLLKPLSAANLAAAKGTP